MIIRRIHIRSFGRFHNYELELTKGLNVIFGRNEDGKSTVMAFLKLLFYGAANRGKDLSSKPRMLYRPWHGGVMGGYIEFEKNGITYRLDRVMHDSDARDEVTLRESVSGKELPLSNPKMPGLELLDLSQAAFEKSIFVAQSAGRIAGGDPELKQRLMNLVSTGEEDSSYDVTLKNLDAAMEQLESRSGKKGKLVEQKNRLDALYAEMETALFEEEQKGKYLHEIDELGNKARDASQRLEIIRNALKGIALRKKQEELLRQIEVRNQLETAESSFAARRKELQRGDLFLSRTMYDAADELYLEWVKQSEFLSDAQKRLSEAQRQAEATKYDAGREVPENLPELGWSYEERMRQIQLELDAADEYLHHLKSIENQRATHEKIQNEHRRTISELTNDQSALEELKQKKETIDQEKEEKIQAVRDLKEESEKLIREVLTVHTEKEAVQRSIEDIGQLAEEKIAFLNDQELQESTDRSLVQWNVPLLLLMVILSVSFLLAGVFVERYFFVGLLLIALLSAVLYSQGFFIQKEDGSDSRGPDSLSDLRIQQIKKQRDERIAQRHAELRELKGMEQMLQQTLQNKNIQLDNIEDALHGLEERSDRLQEEAEKLERSMEGYRGQLRSLATQWSEWNTISIASSLEDIEPDSGISMEEAENRRAFLMKKLAEQQQAQKNLFEQYGVSDLNALSRLETKWETILTKRRHLEEDKEQKRTDYEERKQKLRQIEHALREALTPYAPSPTPKEAKVHLSRWNESLDRLEQSKQKVQTLRDMSRLENRTVKELQTELDQLPAEFILNALDHRDMTKEQIEEKKKERDDLTAQIEQWKQEIAGKMAEAREKYRDRKNVSQLDEEILALKQQIAEGEKHRKALVKARSYIESSFRELQQDFGPKLNELTAQNFYELTEERYHKVAVNHEFGLSFEDENSKRFYDHQYLSGGTIDQAYLALRLAMTELVGSKEAPLPIFLDDVFTQFDDARARAGLRFLDAYVKRNGGQMLLFTCHDRIVKEAEQLSEVTISALR